MFIRLIFDLKGARGVIARYGNSTRKALSDLFPNIGLDWEVGNLYGHVPSMNLRGWKREERVGEEGEVIDGQFTDD